MPKNTTDIALPQHVAIIPDGNRRWAKAHNILTVQGHKRGADQMCTVIDHAFTIGIKVLSIYCLSTENLKRSKEEITYLLELFQATIIKQLDYLKKNNIRLIISGRMNEFPQGFQDSIAKIAKETESNTNRTLNLCLNYGGRTEIVDAIRHIIQDGLKAIEITEDTIKQYLYAPMLPDPDLIIRTSGEMRLSGFLTWQSIYSELFFEQKYCPDFTTLDFDNALTEFSNRKRNFGK